MANPLVGQGAGPPARAYERGGGTTVWPVVLVAEEFEQSVGGTEAETVYNVTTGSASVLSAPSGAEYARLFVIAQAGFTRLNFRCDGIAPTNSGGTAGIGFFQGYLTEGQVYQVKLATAASEPPTPAPTDFSMIAVGGNAYIVAGWFKVPKPPGL